ncbi:MAG: type II toxin-antitoxin system VapC family toxin [Verrucomicrobia bacterium]|nr:type II toxin-antitoxin system VapC family toxin [Verrucomicrobiota bacterium]
MIYFDTSYVLKCYLPEPHHAVVRQLARQQQQIGSCLFGKAECAAGVHRHLREGKITQQDVQTIFAAMHADESFGFLVWLPITPQLIEKVQARFASLPPSVFLRSADAIHLACAQEQGFAEICSNDKHILAAAPHFSLAGRNVIP